MRRLASFRGVVAGWDWDVIAVSDREAPWQSPKQNVLDQISKAGRLPRGSVEENLQWEREYQVAEWCSAEGKLLPVLNQNTSYY